MRSYGVLDIGSGNLYSLMRSLKQLDIRGTIVNRPEELKKLDGLFLPGVGAFKSGMDTLNKNHMLEPIIEYVKVGKPLLGICLGMQLLLSESFEFGNHKGLNFIKGQVKPIIAKDKWPVPNIGWCEVKILRKKNNSPFNNITCNNDFYFIHSYFCDLEDHTNIVGEICYGGQNLAAIISEGNVHGCQFHPELSDNLGFKIFKDFVNL